MSKINQIEKALSEIDSTKFHKLVDSYLSKTYDYQIVANGAKIAEDKPTVGTPDSYAILENGNYVFIEYTTQKTNVVNKFTDDIGKCFDALKTGIEVDNIEKIILACNIDLKPSETKMLTDLCAKNSTKCLILGNSTIANKLFNKCPNIAKDFFDISIDTGQILDYDDFVHNFDANKFDDMISYFNDKNKKYAILIDDVNRIHEALDYTLSYFGERIESGELKIIVTVRDYAKNKIIDKILGKLNFAEFDLQPLNEDSIKNIVKKEFSINNEVYLDRIVNISQGNPRLAIMAALIANKENSLDSLYNIASIYNEYFSNIRKDLDIFDDTSLLLTILIVSFLGQLTKATNNNANL